MSHTATPAMHPFAETARNLARRTNRRAVRWAAVVVAIVLGIIGIGAYGVQSAWVSNTIANADTVANYQNQTLQNDASLLKTSNAQQLYTQTQARYGDEWNALTAHITATQDQTAKTDRQAADKVAGTLLFPNLRGDYQAWATERAQSQPAITAKQEAQLEAVTLAQTACQDHYTGKSTTDITKAFAPAFSPEKATGLERAIITLGLTQCGV